MLSNFVSLTDCKQLSPWHIIFNDYPQRFPLAALIQLKSDWAGDAGARLYPVRQACNSPLYILVNFATIHFRCIAFLLIIKMFCFCKNVRCSDFPSKYGILGVLLTFCDFANIGILQAFLTLTKMYSGIRHCVVVRRGTFTPHRGVPGFEDCVWQAGAVIAGHTQRRLCCRLRFQRVTLLCQAPGSRQRKSRRVGTPELSQRFFLQVHGHIRDTYPAQDDDKSLVFRYICK